MELNSRLSLSFRLFGNVVADELTVGVCILDTDKFQTLGLFSSNVDRGRLLSLPCFFWLLETFSRNMSRVEVLCFLVPFVIPLPIMGLGLFAGEEMTQLFRLDLRVH